MPRKLFWTFLTAFTPCAARAADPTPVDFRTDVIAALSRAGCNQGTCHGSPQGKNGFRLSLRGFDPDLDFYTLTRAEMGRRVDRQRPENSLFLLKGTGRTCRTRGAFGCKPGDPAYRVLMRWVAEGCRDGGPTPIDAPGGDAGAAPLARRSSDTTAHGARPLSRAARCAT